MPTVAPEGMCRSMSSRAFFSASLLYLKETSSKSMEPSATSVTGFSGLCRLGSSFSTSVMRFMDSQEMVIIT